MPAGKYFVPGSMLPDECKKFVKWYDKHKNDEIDLQKELREYCELDVSILARWCRELWRMFIEIGNIDPFQYVTIASVCLALYRCKSMPESSIAVIYNEPKTEVHSKESISRLKFMERKHNVQH